MGASNLSMASTWKRLIFPPNKLCLYMYCSTNAKYNCMIVLLFVYGSLLPCILGDLLRDEIHHFIRIGSTSIGIVLYSYTMAPSTIAAQTIILARIFPILERGNQRRTVCPQNSIFLRQRLFFGTEFAVAYLQDFQSEFTDKSTTDGMFW